jgi:microsomal dipeptidase-like Zn-dependent dipeptidase
MRTTMCCWNWSCALGERPPVEMVLRRGPDRLFERYWLPRLAAGGVGVQVCPLYGSGEPSGEVRARALAQYAEFRAAVAQNAEQVCQAWTRDGLEESRPRLVLALSRAQRLERMRRLGVGVAVMPLWLVS